MAQQMRGVHLHQVNSIDESDGEPNVDVIAIHGLDTKSPDTWIWRSEDGEKPSVNWLSDPDMLPAKLERVRIFTCDWPADLLQDSDSVPWTVGEFARRLLAGILDMRLPLAADAKSRDRPILFIASCLGGIILMKALVMADRPESDYYAIRKATHGIVFLATPFRGTSFQDIAAWVEPMLKTWASLRNRSVAQLLDSVKGSTYDLEQLVRTFTRLCQDADYPCKIHTFYETRETILQSKILPVVLLPWLGQSKLLVDRSSATLDIDSDPLPLERRHVLMNKFCGSHDVDYEIVAGRLAALLQVVRNGPLQQADAWIRDKHYTGDRLQIQRLSGQLLPMDQCYINLVIVERPGEVPGHPASAQSSPFSVLARQKAEYPDWESQVGLATLFNERRGCDGGLMHPRRIFIRGRAGVGKTTLCKKIVHEFQRQTWTEWNKLFDRILWVPLRNLKQEERKRPGYNYERLFNDEYFSLPESRPKLARELAKALATGNSKTLFLLDGLDEVSQFLVGEGTMVCFLQDLLKQPNVIITSRPSAKSLLGMDLELETIGFYDEQVEAYLNADPGIEPKVNEVKSFLQQHWLLQGLVRIPVQLDALCYTWGDFDSGTSPETMTAIYQAIEQKLWRKDAVRLGRMTEAEVESAHCIEIEDKVESEVKLLECLAFAGMYSDVLDFTSVHREKLSRAWRSSGKAYALGLPLDETLGRLSFLRSSDSSTMIKDRSYHFIHLTFQEYFAARYFVYHWLSGRPLSALELGTQQKRSMIKELDAESFLQSEKYNARYDVFWRFVTGLIHAQPDENKLCRFFHMIEDQPRDLLGPVHQRLIMHCLSEVSSSVGAGSFTLLREKLERHLSQWLEFECEFNITYNISALYGRGAQLAREVEFPERSLNDVLERASADVDEMVLDGLRESPRPPQSTIELITRRFELEDIYSQRHFPAIRLLESRKDLPIQTLNALIRCIDQDWQIQKDALYILRSQRTLPEECQSILATWMINRDWKQLENVSEFFSGRPLEYAIGAIVAQLDHPDAVTRRDAIQMLERNHEFAGHVIQAVAALLEDDDPDIRLGALRILEHQQLPSDDMVWAVAGQLGDERVRLSALKVLERQQTLPENVFECIAAQLQDNDRGIQEAAIRTLNNASTISGNVTKTIVDLIAVQDDIVQSLMARPIFQSSSNLQETILRTAVDWLTNPNSRIQLKAFRLISISHYLPKHIIQAMAELLQRHDKAMKLKILKLLSGRGALPTDVLEKVLAQLENRSYRITRAALYVLASSCRQLNQGLPLHVFKSVAAYLIDEKMKSKRKALKVLSTPSKLPNDILSAIASQFKDPHGYIEVRCAALSALSYQTHLSTEILGEIAEQLRDRDEVVREQAALTLGRQSILSQGVLKALEVQLEDEDEHVRSAAAKALCNRSLSEDILDAIAARLADPSHSVRKVALEALRGKPDLPERIVKAVLREASYGGEWAIKEEALRLLGTQASLIPEALPLFVSYLGSASAPLKLDILRSLQSQSTLPDDTLHIVTAQLDTAPIHLGWAALHEPIRWAALKVLDCQLVLPDTIVKGAALYRTWLTQSFREHVSCYVMGGVTYLDVPDGLGKVTLKGDSGEFLEAMRELQKEMGVPRHIHDLYA
ncbi:hypothetical protein CCMA1212_008530 [Trichoderma ghanense]|uniref:NACHT domain-containing protein n=1 Tax=Trichoderma ghanense TaxID=65468 RepID=A0ABY2GVI4_9HYPO